MLAVRCGLKLEMASNAPQTSPTALTGGAGGGAAEKKEIYTYEAPWLIYGMNWSVRPDKKFRLAVGSFVEEYNNKVVFIGLVLRVSVCVLVCILSPDLSSNYSVLPSTVLSSVSLCLICLSIHLSINQPIYPAISLFSPLSLLLHCMSASEYSLSHHLI